MLTHYSGNLSSVQLFLTTLEPTSRMLGAMRPILPTPPEVAISGDHLLRLRDHPPPLLQHRDPALGGTVGEAGEVGGGVCGVCWRLSGEVQGVSAAFEEYDIALIDLMLLTSDTRTLHRMGAAAKHATAPALSGGWGGGVTPLEGGGDKRFFARGGYECGQKWVQGRCVGAGGGRGERHRGPPL